VAKDAPWSRQARVQALQVAADLPDRALAERAGRTLATLGAEPAPPPGGDAAPSELWTDPPPVDPPRPVTVVEPDEASMRAALSRLTVA
ncbi:hypothetical protein, partial [Shigella sonnei]|uniref:hypothetical protein n=1 Tax=Shigella sonnei TaxID=624 RepID=UPI001C12A731